MATKELILTNADFKVLVDEEEYERIIAFGKWKVEPQSGTVVNRKYNVGGKITVTTLTRLILNPPKGKNILHKDGNKLDCRKENLYISSGFEKARVKKGDNQLDAYTVKAVGFLDEIYNVVPLYKYMDDDKLVELESVLNKFRKEA